MAAADFPNSPTIDVTTYRVGDVTYIYRGSNKWEVVSVAEFDDIVYDMGNVSGSVTVDLSLATKFRMTQTGNITAFTFINEVLGRDYLFQITRPTTNWTFTFQAGKFRFPIGATPIMTNPTTNGSAPASATDLLTGLCMVVGRLDIVITPDLQNN
jgi:hypothetical protein